MKTDGMPDHRAIDAAAALWAARMESGELSGADRETLRAWLEQDPAHRWRLAHYQHYSAELDVALPALSAAGKVRLAASPPRRKGRHWGYVSLAAMVALAVAIGIYWRPTAGERGPVFSTHIAERQSVKLADGTRADLNAQTNLAVEFQKSERRVRLDHGEVLFTVAKNLARPFVVETPGGRVRVTGTVFNVRTDLSGQLEVSVLEGHVEVQPLGGVASPEPLRLGVGDHVSLNGSQVLRSRLPLAGIADAAAWREGQAVFVKEPLGAALERFATFHGKVITVAPAIADLTIGGRYSLDDLDGFLFALERTLAVRVEHRADGTLAVLPR